MIEIANNPVTFMPLQGATPPAARTPGTVAGSTLDEAELRRIDEAAQDFEAMFLSEMLRPMFDSLTPDDTFGGGKGEEVYQSMMTQEYGRVMAARGGIGLADQVRETMIRLQEEANAGGSF